MKVLGAWACCLWAALACGASSAANAPWEEYDKLIQKANTVAAHGTTLFGDEVSLQSGALSFRVTDVSLPGNNALPVAIARTFQTETSRGFQRGAPVRDSKVFDAPFRDWELDLPSISGVFAASTGWINPTTGQAHKRCEVANPGSVGGPSVSVAGGAVSFQQDEIWSGTRLSIPGRGSQAMLLRISTLPQPAPGAYWITSDWTSVACLPSVNTSNGGAGQGFIATTKDGVKYRFDWMARNHEEALGKNNPSGGPSEILERARHALYATRVEDRFGNWVNYTYTNSSTAPVKLTRIDASDGRVITVSYSGNTITSITAAGKTWSYGYTGDRLTQVTLPDASRWSIQLDGFKQLELDYEDTEPQVQWRSCGNPGLLVERTYTGTVTHPSGAVGTFTLDQRRIRRDGLPAGNCSHGLLSELNDDEEVYPSAWDAYVLRQKTISGPGLTSATWSYGYGSSNADVTTVVGPGKYEEYTYGNTFRTDEGQLLSVKVGASPTNILSTTTYAYAAASAPSAPYYVRLGDSGQWRSDNFTEEYPRPQLSKEVLQQGATFIGQVEADCAGNLMCFDAYAQPTKVTRASSLGYLRTDITQYKNFLAIWVLGLVEKATCTTCVPGGVVESETVFDGLARPTYQKAFGEVRQILTYYATNGPDATQWGTVSSVSDGRDSPSFDTTVTLSNWKRGIPRTITYPPTQDQPVGESESAAVNDDGTIASVTDELGYTTTYGYDILGRLSLIQYPGGDDVAWADTHLNFAPNDAGKYGLPANHWRQTVHTGNGYKVTYYDAMWRPVVEEAYDSAAPANTRSLVVKRYDSAGRLKFQSYPVRTLTSYTDATLKGITTSYDALDRVIQTAQNWEGEPASGPLVVTTQYLTGFQTRVTNARGFPTTTSYQAYDQPTTDWPVALVHPAAAYTDIVRDPFGKPTSITRRNVDSSVQSVRSYVYNDAQELCKTVEPETGATILFYDAAGNLDWSKAGSSYTGTAANQCNTADVPVAQRTTRSYDARNRLITLNFPDGVGDQVWSYTEDGLPATVTTYNAANQTQPVVNAYHYNKRRMLNGQGENISQPGWYTWGLGYGYHPNGYLSVHTYQNGEVVDYAPNALGQPTQAGAFAGSVSYHPNGGLKQFTYGNGIVHAMTQNLRQLPETSKDQFGAVYTLNDSYDYDENGNVLAISDGLAGGRGNRDMTYDGADRLITAQSLMFSNTASPGTTTYTYDVLDNIKTLTVPATALAPVRSHYYCYGANTWRLETLRSGSCTGTIVTSLSYDAQGNLASKGSQSYTFDDGNRLRQSAGQEAYRYDAHGRRALANGITMPGNILSQYSQSGQLVFQYNQRTAQYLMYVHLGGSLVAIRETPVGTASHVVKYQHTDALGSPVAVTNASRTVIERSEYEPYGKLLNRARHDGPGYTGHVEDALTGLTYMQQRYYDPGIGRFLSVDPVSANAGSMFNRYSYANNNPYSFIDPDGREACGTDTTCRISSGMSPGTINGAIASSRGQTFDKNGGVVGNRSVSDQQIVSAAKRLPDPNRSTEAKIHIAPDGTETGPTSDGCTANACQVTQEEISAGGAIVHLHNVVNDSRAGRISREFPGPGDPDVVRLGLRNGIRTPSNAVRVLDGTGGDVRLRTLHGGSSSLNRYIERNWVPGMTSSEINELATRYRGSYP